MISGNLTIFNFIFKTLKKVLKTTLVDMKYNEMKCASCREVSKRRLVHCLNKEKQKKTFNIKVKKDIKNRN